MTKDLRKDECIWCESDAMVMMDNTLDLKVRMQGRLLASAMRKLANGESFFQQEITASREDGMCLSAPRLPGTVKILEVGTIQYKLSDQAHMAASSAVTLTVRSQNIGSALLGGTEGGSLLVRLTTQGKLLCRDSA